MKIEKMKGFFSRGVVAASVLSLSISAWAKVDVSTVTDGMSDALTAIAVVGAGALGVKIGIYVWKWVGKAMSGA